MDTQEYIVGGIMLVLVVVLVVGIGVKLTGFHYETGTGSHVGYVTSTETRGVFFKTMTAYIKTDTQSSQEDSYCVIDKGVFDTLRSLSEKKSHVEVKYLSYLSAGIANCNGEDDIITSVSETK